LPVAVVEGLLREGIIPYPTNLVTAELQPKSCLVYTDTTTNTNTSTDTQKHHGVARAFEVYKGEGTS
jgi:hypothetical protein